MPVDVSLQVLYLCVVNKLYNAFRLQQHLGQYLCTGTKTFSPEVQWHEGRWETLADAQVGKLAGTRKSVCPTPMGER